MILFLQLCRSMVDHLSDTFNAAVAPMFHMCEAAEAGEVQAVEEREQHFTQHAQQMQKVIVNGHLEMLSFSAVTNFALELPMIWLNASVFTTIHLVIESVSWRSIPSKHITLL